MEKEPKEETKVADTMKAMEEGQPSAVKTEEKTEVDEAMKPMDEGQQSAVQTEEENLDVDEAMKSMEEGKHSVTDPEIKNEEGEEVCKVMKSVEVGQHSAQEKDKEEEAADAVRALERQHSVVEIVVVEEEQQQQQLHHEDEKEQHLQQQQQHHEEEEEQHLQQQLHHEEEEEQQLQQQQHHEEEEEQQQKQHHEEEIVEVEEVEEINIGEAIRVMEVGCASWIIEMEEETLQNTGRVKKTPSIYYVPDRIKRGNMEAYRPKLVSMGPLHYGDADLMPMEHHKKEAMLQRAKRFGKALVDYLASIQEVADELLAQYDSLDEKWHTECREEFLQMMLMDGSFLLESIERHFDYPRGNPVFSYHGCLTLYTTIQSDIVVLENQLPLLVLDTILAVERDTAPSATEVNSLVLSFLGFSPDLDSNILGQHPLHLLQKGMCGPEIQYVGRGWDNTMPSATELSDAGVHFMVSKTQFIHDISFRNGVLSLPVFNADDNTEKQLLNLLAFEKLYSCTGHEVMSYMCFMDNLVNTGRDVELLRSKGVIKNLLSSDEELAQQINSLGTGAIISPFSMLDDVQRMVSNHCRKPWNKWRATFAHTYLRNPWVFLSLLAAVILLVASIVQTVYTVLPFYHKS